MNTRSSGTGAALLVAALFGAIGGLFWALNTVPQPRCDSEQQRSCLLQHKYLPSAMKVVAGMAAGYAAVALFTVWLPEQGSRRRWEQQRDLRIQRLHTNVELPRNAANAVHLAQRQAHMRQPARLPQTAFAAVTAANHSPFLAASTWQNPAFGLPRPAQKKNVPQAQIAVGGLAARPRSERRQMQTPAALPTVALQVAAQYRQEGSTAR